MPRVREGLGKRLMEREKKKNRRRRKRKTDQKDTCWPCFPWLPRGPPPPSIGFLPSSLRIGSPKVLPSGFFVLVDREKDTWGDRGLERWPEVEWSGEGGVRPLNKDKSASMRQIETQAPTKANRQTEAA